MGASNNRFVRASLAIVIGLIAVAPAAAQKKGIELNGFAGLYAPLEENAREGTREAVRRGSLAFGGRLGYWTGGLVGVEAVGAFSQARMRVTLNSGSQFARGTYFGAAGGKLMLNLTPKSSLLGLAVGGGPALIMFGKSVTAADEKDSFGGGVAGVTLRLNVGENVALRGDAEDFFYSADFGLGKKLRHDILLSGGISIQF
ncbi:MAG: porin family protein [Gemmatimonadales bacterium]